MRNVMILTRRELSSYFVSPIAYVVIGLFVAATGFFFASPVIGSFQTGGPADMDWTFKVVPFILVLLIPVLAMRALAEEQGSGTIETLLTAPVTDVEVVLGKWLGCWLVYLVMLAPTALYLVAIATFGNPDYGPIASGYIGLALLGALYVAISLWASSLTRNQVIAAVIGIALLALLGWMAPIIGSVAPPPYRMIAQQLSIPAHADDFRSGVVDLTQIIYFVVFTAYMLFFTVKILESRRWR